MLRSIAATAFVAIVLVPFGAAATTSVDPETAGFRIVEMSCSDDLAHDTTLRCVAEIERLRDDVGMLTAAWGFDGTYLAFDAVTGTLAVWSPDAVPPDARVVNVAVVDPETGLAVEESVRSVAISSVTPWARWWILLAATMVIGAVGVWLWVGRRQRSTGRAAICPACSSPVEDGDAYCPVCGTAVTRADAPAQVFCSACGARVGEADSFCPICGERQPAGGINRNRRR
jgi:RNA polymerase subunit RPABC4/transcription elongation factor Spt4